MYAIRSYYVLLRADDGTEQGLHQRDGEGSAGRLRSPECFSLETLWRVAGRFALV